MTREPIYTLRIDNPSALTTLHEEPLRRRHSFQMLQIQNHYEMSVAQNHNRFSLYLSTGILTPVTFPNLEKISSRSRSRVLEDRLLTCLRKMRDKKHSSHKVFPSLRAFRPSSYSYCGFPFSSLLGCDSSLGAASGEGAWE